MLNSYMLLYESNCYEIFMLGYLLRACTMVKISYPMDVYLWSCCFIMCHMPLLLLNLN
jgi:hypothetical protein